ncbi:MAG: hypothetical protein ACRDNS_07370 [Trebonia sp.]
MQADGAIVLHPAAVVSKAQAALLQRPDITQAIETLAADPSSGIRRGRPRRPAGT